MPTIDPEMKEATLELCELCREALIGASETRLIALRIHQALVNAQVPGYLEHMNRLEMTAEGPTRRLIRDLETTVAKLRSKIR
jgi:hypothetical protein